jgi:hypothetical protein
VSALSACAPCAMMILRALGTSSMSRAHSTASRPTSSSSAHEEGLKAY